MDRVIDVSRAEWRKSRRSGNGGSCVEVATNLQDVVAIRDSKDPHGPLLAVTADDWRAFGSSIRDGQFDL